MKKCVVVPVTSPASQKAQQGISRIFFFAPLFRQDVSSFNYCGKKTKKTNAVANLILYVSECSHIILILFLKEGITADKFIQIHTRIMNIFSALICEIYNEPKFSDFHCLNKH